MRVVILLILLFSFLESLANKPELSVSNIPSELLLNSSAVIRNSNYEFTITSYKSNSLKHSFAITLLNENAKEHAVQYFFYNKSVKIKHITATIYDKDGNEVKKLRDGGVRDISATNNSTFLSSDRIKYFDLNYHSYPYTLEVSYNIESQNSLNYPIWNPSENQRIAIENARFLLFVNDTTLFKYQNINSIGPPRIDRMLNGDLRYIWQIRNQTSQAFETYSNSIFNGAKALILSPNQFNYDGFKGNMDTWQQFGMWINELNKGRNDLDPAIKNLVLNEVRDASDDREKVKIIYEFMQKRTRYLSVQLGIGGYQPFNTSLVHNKGYGDCKALSYYTKSLLELVGINAFYTLVSAGSTNNNRTMSEFPYNSFNHVILSVPLQGDTIWLECTSQTQPVGFLGSFTSNRNVLLITDQGGVIARTPSYYNNEINTTGEIIINDQLDVVGSFKFNYSGLETEYNYLSFTLELSTLDQKNWFSTNSGLTNFEINNFNLYRNTSEEVSIIGEVNAKLNSIISKNGSRYFLQTFPKNGFSTIPIKTETRKNPVYIEKPFMHTDSITYTIPSKIYPEYLPETISINSVFGDYKAEFHYQEGQLIYKRTVRINKGEFPASEYNNMVNFYKEMVKADKTKVVFNNRT